MGWRRQVEAGNVNMSIISILMLLKVLGLGEIREKGSSESEVSRAKPWTISVWRTGRKDGGAKGAKKES